MSHVTIEEAERRLSDLITETPPGQEIILTRDSRPIAKLIPLRERPQPRRGSGKGFIGRIAEDFSETPEGFEEYAPCKFLWTPTPFSGTSGTIRN